MFRRHLGSCRVNAWSLCASRGVSSTFDGIMVEQGRCTDPAPRAEQDFTLPKPGSSKDDAPFVVPGSHPLPLSNDFVKATTWPLVSPYMPSPHRTHPYWKDTPEELLCFNPSIPNVFGPDIMTHNIVVPVFNLNGEVVHSRKLSNFLFGLYPQTVQMQWAHTYWVVRNHNMADQWDFSLQEVNRRAKKNWQNTGTGMGRVSQRKDSVYPWGAHGRPNKPWNKVMPLMDPVLWQKANRMMLTLKLLQGKVQVVSELDLPEATPTAFKELCDKMKWDVRHDGAGVMFMDGGSRLTPSIEFNNNFFYGSFHNGRNKLVRPTIMTEESVDSLRHRKVHPEFLGPRGAKNPVPINRFNVYDALDHHLLVVTEGALHQLEQEIFPVMYETLPPHIRQQLPDIVDPMTGSLFEGSELLGDSPLPLSSIETEVAGRIEESEKAMYEPFYDNPYKPWADEERASYYVNAVDGYVTRHVSSGTDEEGGSSKPTDGSQDDAQSWEEGSWRVLE